MKSLMSHVHGTYVYTSVITVWHRRAAGYELRMHNRNFFNFARCVRKLALYGDVIHSFDWKSAIEHDGGV